LFIFERLISIRLCFPFQHKLIIYESYVKDLSIQTRLLLQSLEELEKEANQRVALLENKLKKAHITLQVCEKLDFMDIKIHLFCSCLSSFP